MRTSLVVATLIAVGTLALCGKKAEASALPTEETSAAQTLPEYEPYPGFNTAIRKTLDAEREYALRFWKKQSTPEVDDSGLPSKSFLNCERESVSVNMWLLSQHASKERKRDLNEKNRGFGIFYTCDNWSLGFDRMVNSNEGKARILSLLWGAGLAELGPIFLAGKIGIGRLRYGVPRLNATLHKTSVIGFASVGLVNHPEWRINVAPVPETAGDAYIVWITYTFELK